MANHGAPVCASVHLRTSNPAPLKQKLAWIWSPALETLQNHVARSTSRKVYRSPTHRPLFEQSHATKRQLLDILNPRLHAGQAPNSKLSTHTSLLHPFKTPVNFKSLPQGLVTDFLASTYQGSPGVKRPAPFVVNFVMQGSGLPSGLKAQNRRPPYRPPNFPFYRAPKGTPNCGNSQIFNTRLQLEGSEFRDLGFRGFRFNYSCAASEVRDCVFRGLNVQVNCHVQRANWIRRWINP